ncbi:RNA polymerase sigma factor [Planctomycetes bacterium Poly30]|uniref:RNA polymerase sigma factor n=1 Tax=Saltatorellus ferox TaxID=2528018 RepID=A0A518EXR4_9BACT|nr:RNA polymerase sigma factor [Planctomycetes bacterium Poly30]
MATSALDDAALIERQRLLLGCVDGLPDGQRRVILMRFYEGLAPRRIAAAEAIAVSTVHSRIQRGLETLRAELDRSFGDRRTWATWMAPMGSVVPRAQALGAAGLVVAAGAVALVALAAGAWKLAQPVGVAPTEPLELVGAKLTSAGSAAAKEPGAAAEFEPVPEQETTRRADAPRAAEVPVSVRVVADGVPVPNADVIALPTAEISGDVRALYQLEATLWNQGTRFRADEAGVCAIDVRPPFLVVASDQARLGFGSYDRGAVDPEIELKRAARLTVRVVDRFGAPLDEPAMEGLGVTAFTRVDLPKDIRYPEGNDIELGFTHQLHRGEAWFQHCWIGQTWNQAEIGPDRWSAVSIEAVALDIPGAAEFEPDAVVARRFRPFKKKPGDQERTLTLPSFGSVQFVVIGSNGERDPLNGSVSVRFRSPPYSGASSALYTARLEDGVALFPRFVIGSRAFEATVTVPEIGATWSFEDVGPGREGERRHIETIRRAKPRLSATLVDGQGRPLAETQVTLSHGLPGYGDQLAGLINAVTGPGGEMRIEVPDDGKITPPLSVVARRTTGAGLEEALQILDLTPEEILAGADLGELVLRWEKPVRLEGTVVDGEGTPIPGVDVTLARPGRIQHGARTDGEGRFTFTETLGAAPVLKARHGSGQYFPDQVDLDPDALEEPLVLTLGRGATFLATLDASSLPAARDVVKIVLQDEEGKYVFVESLGQGRFRAPALRPGIYRAELRLEGGHVPVAKFEGIEVPASGEVRDPRVDGVRLSDLIREISVTVNGEVPDRLPTILRVMAVQAPVQIGRPGASLVYSVRQRRDAPRPLLLPLRMDHAVMFETYDGRVASLANGRELEDIVDFDFLEPIVVRVELQGQADSGFSYSLRGEAGTPTAGTSALTRGGGESFDETSASFEASFPMPGVYRLYRAEKSEPFSGEGGMVAASVASPTEATIEVRNEGTPTLRIDAPPVER